MSEGSSVHQTLGPFARVRKGDDKGDFAKNPMLFGNELGFLPALDFRR